MAPERPEDCLRRAGQGHFVWLKEKKDEDLQKTLGISNKGLGSLPSEPTRTRRVALEAERGGQAATSDSVPVAFWKLLRDGVVLGVNQRTFPTWCQVSAWAGSEWSLWNCWASEGLWSRHSGAELSNKKVCYQTKGVHLSAPIRAQ